MPDIEADGLRLAYQTAGSADREPLLLLHGILGSSRAELLPLIPHLAVNYSLLSLDFRMHGNSVAPRPGFNIQDLCSDILRLSDHLGIERFHVFGYSLGGYAALCLEKIRPGRVRSLLMHGTKFYWDAANADSFARRLDPDFIERRQAKWAEQLRSLHDGQGPGHWKRLCVAAADFVRTLPGTFSDADIAAVHFPVQVSLGDRDDLVPLAEAASLARALPHGSLSVLPDTRHPIGACDPAILASQIDAFIRRAREGGE